MARNKPIIHPNAAMDNSSDAEAQESGNINMHTALENVVVELPVNWLSEALTSADNAIAADNGGVTQELQTIMVHDNSDHSDPDPRKNSLVSNIHVSNASMRLQAEAAICREKIHQIDTKIAELQAERTDLTGEYAMYTAGINAAEKL